MTAFPIHKCFTTWTVDEGFREYPFRYSVDGHLIGGKPVWLCKYTWLRDWRSWQTR